MSVELITKAGYVTIVLPDPAESCLSRNNIDQLTKALEAADRDPTIFAVEVCGGKDTFCHGVDLSEFADEEGFDALAASLLSVFTVLATIRKPLFAGVNGRASGMGLTMLTHMSYVAASSTAQFSAPFVGLGLVPEAGSTALLPQRMGVPSAFRLLCLGETLNAEEMQRQGLVSKVVDHDPQEHVSDIVRRYVRQPTGARETTLRLLKQTQVGLHERMAVEIEESRLQLVTGGTRELLHRLVKRMRRNEERAVERGAA